MAGRYRRGTITTPSQAGVANFSWQENTDYDRSQSDSELAGDPVKMRTNITGSFELVTGALPADRYGQNMVAVLEDVSVSSGTETVTSRTYTFTKVTFKRGANSASDAQRGAVRVEFEAAAVSET